jgi:alpha-1,3-glucan synthase
MFSALFSLLITLIISMQCAPWTPENAAYNLNQNAQASSPINYHNLWENHTYFPSPSSWRFPFYTLMLDRFADGNPRNNDISGTLYEFDPLQVNFRHGGDIQGLKLHLDYLADLGIKGIYIAGTPFLNEPWDYHSYNPLDFTLLDPHFGNLQEWRDTIQAIHDKGMYVLLDLTISTMGDLLYFDG